MPTYGRKDVVFERGEGNYLYATDGRRYLDFTSGIAVNALGHCHPTLVKALTEQGQKLWHTSNLFRVGNGEKLAQRLVDVSFADTMFFCNSGAEAIEGGIKLIRKYQFMNGKPKRYKIICFQAAFHGRLLNALAATGNEKRARDTFQELAKLLLPARDNLEVMKQALRDLEKAIDQQKEVKEQTKEATKPKAEKTEAAEAEKKQAEVVDKTDSIREDVEKAAPKAAEDLKAAVEKQQEARAQLQQDQPKRTQSNESPAVEKQEQALAKMEAAKQTLEQQIAKAEAAQQKPKDKLADLKELKKTTRSNMPRS